jgi:hypothetical protein
MKNLQQNSQGPDQYSNRAIPEYKATATIPQLDYTASPDTVTNLQQIFTE